LRGAAVEGAALLEHADDRVRLAVEEDVLAHDRRVRSELRLPQRVAQKHDMVLADLVLVRPECAAERRPRAVDIEVVRGDALAAQLNRLLAPRQRRAPTGLRGHVLKHLVLLDPVEVVQRRDAVAPAVRPLLEHADDAVGVGVRQRVQQHAVDEAEHRRVRADREGDRDDRDGGIAGTRAQRA
jgi:hypothetical protein